MKRTPLVRKTALRQHSPLKRTGELKRHASSEEIGRVLRASMRDGKEAMRRLGESIIRKTALRKVNSARAAKRRLRDFGGPYGDIVIPRLPCCVCYPWFYNRPDDEIREAMADVLFDPDRFAVVSEPAHVTHSRGAGGGASCIVPLDDACHAEQHADGIETFAAAHPANDFPALASRLWRLWLTFNVSEDVWSASNPCLTMAT